MTWLASLHYQMPRPSSRCKLQAWPSRAEILTVTHKSIEPRKGLLFRHEGTKTRRSDRNHRIHPAAKSLTGWVDFFVPSCLRGEKSN
jgi:hypothetical protein